MREVDCLAVLEGTEKFSKPPYSPQSHRRHFRKEGDRELGTLR